MKELYLAWTPFDFEKESCEFFIGEKRVIIEYQLKNKEIDDSEPKDGAFSD